MDLYLKGNTGTGALIGAVVLLWVWNMIKKLFK